MVYNIAAIALIIIFFTPSSISDVTLIQYQPIVSSEVKPRIASKPIPTPKNNSTSGPSKKLHVYSYKDEEGVFRTITSSKELNVTYVNGRPVYSDPTVDNEKLGKTLNARQWHNKETKFQKNGSTLIIPAIIGHKGREVSVNLIVDTGCSTTHVHYEKLISLHPSILGKVKSVLADGSISNSMLAEVDYIIVGPIKEENFQLTTRPFNAISEDYSGLLGMNFLKEHPFRIDFDKQVIVWK